MEILDFNNVLKDIKPTQDEIGKVKQLSEKLINLINRMAEKKGMNAQAVLVGSVAKGTWLGKADIDIFIKFPPDTSEDELRDKGLKLGGKCIDQMNGKQEFRYASHPYVTGKINGYEIDFVPCYSINSASEIKSAVDRTILHTTYIKENLNSMGMDHVLLLKKFMESINTYSAESKVGGFSGYLCELLIINYGSFSGVLKAASEKWLPGTGIDIENHGTVERFSEPLVVIDPTDRNRNVSAALTHQKLSEFIIASRNFLDDPRKEYFRPKILKFNKDDIRKDFQNRGTRTFLIKLRAPKVPVDALYPQIRKTESSIKRVLEREDFHVLDSASWTDEKERVMILLELEVWKLPGIKKHYGPPIWSREHQKRFLSKYKHDAYVEGDKWVVTTQREYRDARLFIDDILAHHKKGLLRLGKHIKKQISEEHHVGDVLDYLDKFDEDELLFFYEYLHKGTYLWR